MKNLKSSFFTFLLLLIISTTVFSQGKKKIRWTDLIDTTSKRGINFKCEDYVYKTNIKTVQLRAQSFELAQPILNLDSDDKLVLKFDDLDAGNKNFMYTFIHCNADWTPDDLSTSDYIEGFSDNMITDYKFSYNTLQLFTYYSAVFPNDNVHFTKSGNYILKVYQDGKPDNIVLTRRFMIYQNKVSVIAKVKPASLVEYRTFKQELDFTINYSGYPISNPYDDLHIVITQNNRWDNAKKNLKPVFVKDDELVYDYDDVNVFDGGSEFRYFDIKSIRYQSERIKNITKDTAGNHVELTTDERRSSKRYTTYTDMNGNYLVKIQEGTTSETEADYCYVTFFLSSADLFSEGDVYVAGAFNQWNYTAENKMHYEPKRFGYECTLYLKQGYYNYEYVVLKPGETIGDQTEIEGMHYDTENDYCIYVYHHQPETFYDQLISVRRLNSIKDR
jgi:Domain of unknown function (DUF5103)